MCQTGLQSLGTTPKITFTSLWRTPAQVTQAEPPLIVQAREAMGNLRIPTVHLAFNPPGRTIVGIATWWWADHTPDHIRGTSAWGLVAIAEPTGLDINPGDGTDVLHCPWTATKTAAEKHCTSTYTKSSITGTTTYKGQPAYDATATPTWNITFDNDGTPVTFPELDTTIPGPTTQTPVPVAEVQSIATSTN